MFESFKNSKELYELILAPNYSRGNCQDGEILPMKNLTSAQIQQEKFTITLVEPAQKNQPACRVIIEDVPEDLIAIYTDDFFLPTIFNKNKENGLVNREDYVLVSDSEKCVIYIELKNSKLGQKIIINQLKILKLFYNLCYQISRDYSVGPDIRQDYSDRFVAIAPNSTSKSGKTEVNRQAVNSAYLGESPEKYLRINEARVTFSRLLSKG
ncbi:MAG: hypothetical protein K0U66_01650 [Gammaproteobacteria bacterium]|nr:hypothetical protein [Gammaproteobacteria bacterium]